MHTRNSILHSIRNERVLSVVAGLAAYDSEAATGLALGGKRERQQVPSSSGRISVWERFGDDMLDLKHVAVRWLAAPATSAATERN